MECLRCEKENNKVIKFGGGWVCICKGCDDVIYNGKDKPDK